MAIGDTHLLDEFEITITAEEPPSGGGNVTARYAKGTRIGVFSLSSVAAAVASLNGAMFEAQPSQPVLEANGSALFAAIFNGQVGAAWRECATLAQEHKHGIRLRLYSELPSIIAVPWEYLYDGERQSWLVLQPDLSLVRSLPVAGSESLLMSGTLRVLVMLSAPDDLQPRLDVTREWNNLQGATAGTAIELVRVDPTYEALQGALYKHKPHVFHFIGHGAQGALVFCRSDNIADLIAADRLAILLAGCTTLRLVFLNACRSAVTGAQAAFAGVAQRLLQQGIAAVIAMQAAIYDDHALRFSQEFYRAFAEGLRVEQAVSEGRKRINEVAWTWGIPTVYFQGIEPFAMRNQTQGEPSTAAVTQTLIGASIRTGGAVVSSNAETGRNFIGCNQYYYGATPEQFADMLTRLFGLMVEIPQARTLLSGARSLLENARLQLRRLAEYKEAHDLLQQLESSYLVIHSLIYDEGELLAPTQVRWRSLERSCDDLQSSIQRLCNAVESTSFATDVTGCREELAQATNELGNALAGRNLDLLDALLDDVQRVIGTQTPRMNDRLIAAVDGLQLAELAQRLAAMHGALMKTDDRLAQAQVDELAAFSGDVNGLVQLAERLTALRNAHDRWQHADNELRTEQAMLLTAARRFPLRWQRTLAQRLRDLCAPAENEQERTLALQIAAVDAALTPLDLPALSDAVDNCRRAVSRRLNQIDHDLRTLCTLLSEAGGPLDALLEKLV